MGILSISLLFLGAKFCITSGSQPPEQKCVRGALFIAKFMLYTYALFFSPFGCLLLFRDTYAPGHGRERFVVPLGPYHG